MSLASILRDNTLTHTFAQFLQHERAAENYYFWRDVQVYKQTFNNVSALTGAYVRVRACGYM